MNIKTQFQDEQSVVDFIHNNLQEYVATIRASVGHLEQEYIVMKRRRAIGSSFFVASSLVLAVVFSILDIDIDGITRSFTVMALVGGVSVLAVIFLFVGYKKMKGSLPAILKFNHALRVAIFPLTIGVFGLQGTRIGQTSLDLEGAAESEVKTKKPWWNRTIGAKNVLVSTEKAQLIALLDHSELITEPRNSVLTDDMFNIDISSTALFVAELDVRNVTGSGKRKKTKKIFKGYFVSLDLDTELEGKTFVSTEGDKKGFGHQSFWKNVQKNDVQVTELEWNDFENLLHVATTHPTEARYILTPDFMQDVYDWWKDKKVNIRISFIDGRMYLLFPDNRIRMGKTINHISDNEVAGYVESVCLPLLHVLHLVEDAKKQFNRS